MTDHYATSSGSQKSNESTKPVPVIKEIEQENENDIEEIIQENIKEWTSDLFRLPPVSHDKIHEYLAIGKSFGNEPKGALKHKINGYQFFKKGFVKKIRVKDNIMYEKKSFLVECLVSASTKNIRCQVYVHFCQVSGDIRYEKYACKAGYGGCCKHVGPALYELVEYRQLDIKVLLDNKTCTDILQKWHVPGEVQNQGPIKFSELQFYKADVRKDDKGCRKDQLSVEVGTIVTTYVFLRAIRKHSKKVT